MSTQPLPEPGPERRIALLPLTFAGLGVVLAIIVTVVIVSLATTPGTDAAAPALPTSEAPAPLPTTAGTAPVAPLRPEPKRNECVDDLGDGGTFDLDSAAVEDADGELLTRFTLADTAQGAGDTSLGVTVSSRDGRTSYLLAVLWTDGELRDAVVADLAADDRSGKDREDDNPVDSIDLERVSVDGLVVTVRFPEYVLDDLGKSWAWSAAASSASTTDLCPAVESLPYER